MNNIIRKYPFACLYIFAIFVLCLMPIPETPLSQVNMIDKWTHLVMYGGLCTMIWAEYGYRHRTIDKRKVLLFAFIAPILMGGFIEFLQATCTGGQRSGDIFDFLANSLGVVLGQIIGIPLALMLSKRNKD